MKPTHIGTFSLGYENVALVVWPSLEGGEFYLCPDETSVGRIKIGINGPWDQIVSWLLHETMEYAAARKDVRFRPSGKLNGDHGDYLFVMDHSAFGEICSRAALFLTNALPRLATVYDKYHRRKKR